MKKTLITLIIMSLMLPLFGETKLNQYFGKTYHGNMMGKIITADLIITDDKSVDFTVNTPTGKKLHQYAYEIVEETESKIVVRWFENGKLSKTVTFSNFNDSYFEMELKGKGKIKMQQK